MNCNLFSFFMQDFDWCGSSKASKEGNWGASSQIAGWFCCYFICCDSCITFIYSRLQNVGLLFFSVCVRILIQNIGQRKFSICGIHYCRFDSIHLWFIVNRRMLVYSGYYILALQTELERERIALELEEEKKAQAEREKMVQQQAKKIENLSSMVLYSNRDENRDCFKKVCMMILHCLPSV